MHKKLLKTVAAVTAMVRVLSASMVSFAAEDYTVQSGDYLKKIAKQSYGDENKWEVIYEANKGSIKNPNIIYKGQVLVIPDLTNSDSTAVVTDVTVNETTPAPTPTAEATTPVADTAALPVKNIPVGNNPMYTDYTGGGYKYTFTDGTWIHCPAIMDSYSEATDIYGVTYRDYCGEAGTNERIMKNVADFIANNPDSNFASYIKQYGTQFVMVTTGGGLWDDASDYSWYYGIVDCEPEDGVYMFLPWNAFAEDCVEESCNELFNSVSDNIEF